MGVIYSSRNALTVFSALTEGKCSLSFPLANVRGSKCARVALGLLRQGHEQQQR